jgi:hypothetical protein
MKELFVRLIPEGAGPDNQVPLNIVLVDIRDIKANEIGVYDAIKSIAGEIRGPVGINIFDMDAVTTTSDGLVVEGTIIAMAAGDNGKVHPEFGFLTMFEMEVTDTLIDKEPHLQQIKKLYNDKKMFRGPDPATRKIPVHNAVITGRAVNNNSATEMMNVVTMDEILLPIMGQLQLMRDKEVLFGLTGEHISVGIGMTVAEKFGRIFPYRQFRAGDTAHASGEYSKTLKKHIPCIVAPKSVFADHIVRALNIGMIPGLHIGCAPAIISVARAMGSPVAVDNITPKAKEELLSINIDVDKPVKKFTIMSGREVIENADEIIPGLDNPVLLTAEELVKKQTINI